MDELREKDYLEWKIKIKGKSRRWQFNRRIEKENIEKIEME